MLIRKNTKAFKTILHLIETCVGRPDRETLVRLYITRAGNSIRERISTEALQGDSRTFYEMNYQTVLNSLRSSNHQLYSSDEIPGIYYFHSTSNKAWDETPFEFDESIAKEFSSLPELPVGRKKEKVGKFVIPPPTVKTKTAPATEKKTAKKEVPEPKPKQVQGPKQPDFKLDKPIEFTNLERVVYRQPRLSKEEVLIYYNKIADYILPSLKDRPLWARQQSESSREPVALTMKTVFKDDPESVPDWVKPAKVANDKAHSDALLCNDREYLLLYVEDGFVEFRPSHGKIKNADFPDYILLAIDSPESEVTKAVQVALVMKEILDGLKLPSFVKTDGISGLHVYIPLDSKSEFESCSKAARFICQLVGLRIPDLISITDIDEYTYGRVTLDFSSNAANQHVVAPYSLMRGASATIATPMLWEEVTEDLRLEEFNIETIFKRLKDVGDPFETLFRKKVNADLLLERLRENYSFLFDR